MNKADKRFPMWALRNIQIKLEPRFKIVGYRLNVDHHGLEIVEKGGGVLS